MEATALQGTVGVVEGSALSIYDWRVSEGNGCVHRFEVDTQDDVAVNSFDFM
jgi:hypothetical protein